MIFSLIAENAENMDTYFERFYENVVFHAVYDHKHIGGIQICISGSLSYFINYKYFYS